MKKKSYPLARRVGACVGAAAISATMLSGCNWFRAEENEPQDVYGPPLDLEDYRPEDEEIECVYGPPEWFEEDYDPEEDLPAPVYGPPEDFEIEIPVSPSPEADLP